jgi:ASCH domain
MKALTLRPHWAWLVVNGYKNIENRSWPTRLRGRIWIHASSSRVTKAEYDHFLTICRERRIKRFPQRGIYDRSKAVFEYFGLPFDAEPPA